MKKIFLLILILFLFTGCLNYTELNDLAVVQSMTIDYRDNNYYIDCYIIKKNETEKEIEKISENGSTISEVFNKIYQKTSKMIYLSHTDLVLLTKNLIDSKLEDTINYFLDNNSSRSNFNLGYIDNAFDLEIDMNKFIKIVEEESSTTKTITFEEFVKELFKYNNSYLPIIEKKDDITINGIILIDNYKTYDILDSKQSLIYNLINNNVRKGSIDDINIQSNTTVISIKKNKIKIDIKSVIDKKNSNYREVISKEINDLYIKYRDNNFDIFRFNNTSDLEINVKGVIIN